MRSTLTTRRLLATSLCATGLLAAGCAGVPTKSRITFVTPEAETASTITVADASLGAGWAGVASVSEPTTFLALGAGDRLGMQVRQNDYFIAMGLTPQTGTRLADVPVTND